MSIFAVMQWFFSLLNRFSFSAIFALALIVCAERSANAFSIYLFVLMFCSISNYPQANCLIVSGVPFVFICVAALFASDRQTFSISHKSHNKFLIELPICLE